MVEWDYDEHSDVMYISFGERRPAICIEDVPGVLVRVDDDEKVEGITLINFSYITGGRK